MLITSFTNSELQRYGMDASLLLIEPRVEKFVAWAGYGDSLLNPQRQQNQVLQSGVPHG